MPGLIGYRSAGQRIPSAYQGAGELYTLCLSLQIGLDEFIFDKQELKKFRDDIRTVSSLMSTRTRAKLPHFLVWDWIMRNVIRDFKGERPTREDFALLLNPRARRRKRIESAQRLQKFVKAIADDANHCDVSPPNWDYIYRDTLAKLAKMV